ncbi:thioesterase family protein [Bradyrhizobium sp. U87765 SZCCT0131]|uniref:acyl-CoA thioesterase domain-containing protein n=1 Tax=unclassified Bradyrhizobium TaxID=2631580 RepID=UPI001BA8F356|nr:MULTISPECIES: acyl-CoA thioesterase domain-containing protein [unclassified Bradyrhizobium]MBR1222781.1 thioesterase family protein [Bradyrhizobium sp. U87765 SZCCT0131]MBR1265138.1 thioesterase family protein [Bradyrhizobium sp. U87765 SZCCT0134]MBR1303083.1 thioesterase family protein [Bradyrhizobium sp. U87765 SZCCT0110]MBR1318689.1 thioesterase family protein [Bradyrhizobium sp. U87765 SZCCT0109]MBR1347012.1 thioesterase family protein [Bradyrhizobium sp. U87765 SZCCT0048]
MPIFTPLDEPNHWLPGPLAAGPFTGLQGGAVAGLLTAEVEALAVERQWGTAVGMTAHFLRPTPLAPLRTQAHVVTAGGRVSVIDNTLWAIGRDDPCAVVRVTLARERAVAVPGFAPPPVTAIDPARYPERYVSAAHDGPWFWQAMEARHGNDVFWFRLKDDVIAGAGVLARVLGPADWCHGIGRPLHNVALDPNPNLSVHLLRPPVGEWIGVRPQAWWQPQAGIGAGQGTIHDTDGVIGAVAMSVVLLPWPAPVAAPVS